MDTLTHGRHNAEQATCDPLYLFFDLLFAR